jgi:(1->4)-alpha-D-glucan 1-alpha-D-glucosylmutase
MRLHRQDSLLDDNIAYLVWQTLVGAWPVTPERLSQYVEKASREAKQQTSWIDPDEQYDSALQEFVTSVLADEELVADIERFVARLAPAWHTTAVAQKLIQLTMPGVPDVYQGTELWTLSLVDPDNRRPVDYALRRRLLSEADTLTPEALWERAGDGLPKLAVTSAALALRSQRPDAFGPEGSYARLTVTGAKAEHLVAFSRGEAVVTLAPRLVLGLDGDWQDSRVVLPPGRWRDVLSGDDYDGGSHAVAGLLGRLPVALLSRVEE